MNLIEGIQEEMNRVRELRTQYAVIGPSGIFGCSMIDAEIKLAEKAVAESDIVEMLKSCKRLQGITG